MLADRNVQYRLRLAALAVVAAAVTAWVPTAKAQSGSSSAETWRRWEHQLTSANVYDNPYLDHILGVVFTGPGEVEYEGYGFWDGEDTFIIRFMFPEPGTWSWTTTFSDASDTGLHGQTGTVSVTSYDGPNPLFENGYLKVGASDRRLVHANDEPFLFLADTAWLAHERATDAEWQSYIDDRVGRGFSAVVISVVAQYRNAEGIKPFTGTDATMWKPLFWGNVDDMVQYANDEGLIVVACGLAKSRLFADENQGLAFARGFAARMAGNHVAFSPLLWGPSDVTSPDLSAEEVAKAAPLHLITQHLERRPMPELGLELHAKSYLDFSGVQTGKGAGTDLVPSTFEEASRAQLEWVDALYQATPAKPVIVLEGMYENHVDQTEFRREMLRRQAYMSFLRGAHGFSTSAFGVWAWGQTVSFRPEWGSQSLSDALALPYNDYMAHLADFLGDIEAWELIPYAEEALVLNQATDNEHTMLMAKTVSGDRGVAYLPDNDAITIDMSAFPETMDARWFQTTTGTYSTLGPIPNIGTHSFAKPPGWDDAVLVLEAQRDLPSASPAGRLMLSLLLVAAGATFLARRERFGV